MSGFGACRQVREEFITETGDKLTMTTITNSLSSKNLRQIKADPCGDDVDLCCTICLPRSTRKIQRMQKKWKYMQWLAKYAFVRSGSQDEGPNGDVYELVCQRSRGRFQALDESGEETLLRVEDIVFLPINEERLAKFFTLLHETRMSNGLDVRYLEEQLMLLASSDSVLAMVFVANMETTSEAERIRLLTGAASRGHEHAMYSLGHEHLRRREYALGASCFKDFLSCRYQKDRWYSGKELYLKCENEDEDKVDWWGYRGRVGLERCRAGSFFSDKLPDGEMTFSEWVNSLTFKVQGAAGIESSEVERAAESLKRVFKSYHEMPLYRTRSIEKRESQRISKALKDFLAERVDGKTNDSEIVESDTDTKDLCDCCLKALAQLVVLNDNASGNEASNAKKVLAANLWEQENVKFELALSRLRKACAAVESRMSTGKLCKIVQSEHEELEAAARSVASYNKKDFTTDKLLERACELRDAARSASKAKLVDLSSSASLHRIDVKVCRDLLEPSETNIGDHESNDHAHDDVAVTTNDDVHVPAHHDQADVVDTKTRLSKRERQQERRQQHARAKRDAAKAADEAEARTTLREMQVQTIAHGIEFASQIVNKIDNVGGFETPPKTFGPRRRHCRPKFSMTVAELWRDMDWAPHVFPNTQTHVVQGGEDDIDSTCHQGHQSDAESVEISVLPHQVLFTHNTISSYFRCGIALDDAIEAILDGKESVDDYPPLELVQHDGHLWSLSNRRLYVFRVLAAMDKVHKVKAVIWPMESERVARLRWDGRLQREASKWIRSFSTNNGGRSVSVASRYSTFQLSDCTACAYMTSARRRARSAKITRREEERRSRATSVG